MATEIKLPRLGQGMESGTIVKWLKSEGEEVAKGEPLYELDTDKVTQEVESDAAGVLLKIAIREGEVEVGRTVAVIGEQGEEVSLEEPSVDGGAATRVEETEQEEGSAAPAREPERERAREAAAAPAAAEPARADVGAGRVKASPLARRIARERGIELASISGTGPEGRVVAEDVERAAAAPAAVVAPAVPAEEGVERRELTSLRRAVARRMTQAWEAPAFQLGLSADMGRALALRERLVELHAGGAKPTISDLLTKVCAAALMRHRDVNALYAGDAIEIHPSANIGIAVATERGLIVPVIRASERKSIAELAEARADLVSRAREGKLRQDDLEGGTFTISNLGMYGIEEFTAVLNPPQAAILAVGAVREEAVQVEGQLAFRPRLHLTLTCDHRSLDGATGAEFLATVKAFLEEPALAL
jgi:pyruvate dehydrogenase E2 component (dihydrolipoamide acetyltransferase)